MYESITQEVILNRMLDRVREVNPEIDAREGSLIYDALAPASIELRLMYIEFDVIMNETFADTAHREWLIKRCAERGITPYPAKKAILKGVFTPDTVEIAIGERFSLETQNYIVTEKISAGVYKLECETVGITGNHYFGAMVPINYIAGLETATLTELLIPGEDEEATEDLRKRYFSSFRDNPYGGNIADYKEKVNAIQGVGGVKVYPVWNGGGTVKLVIINSDFKPPTAELITTVQTAVDPVTNSGQGVGVAPVGHVVTVLGVQQETINITANITFQSGWDYAACKAYVEAVIDNYFIELNKNWANTRTLTTDSGLIIRVSQIETRLLDVAGILDIENTTINGVAANFTVDPVKIPVRGTINGY